MSELLRPYVPRLVIDWLRDAPGVAHRRVDGSLVFADISGFTNLTERLARRGKVGAEEMGDILNATFEQLLVPAYEYGAALIKWGGDAVLLHYDGAGHAARACRSAVEMQRVIRRVGRVGTGAGSVRLRMSVGVQSGSLDFFLVGQDHRELVVIGPAASGVAVMEQQAEAGEIVISRETAGSVDPACLGDPRGDGWLLAAPPEADPSPSTAAGGAPADLSVAVPVAVREHLLTGIAESEHRQVTTAFVQFSGCDELLATEGPAVAGAILDDLIGTAQEAAAGCGVTFLATDVARDGGKIILLSGAPRSRGDADERMLGALRRILESPCRLPLRAGVTHGRIFTGDFGPAYRRTYSVVGDTVNLAARLMAKAGTGQLVALPGVVERAGGRFEVEPLEPFLVKGKSEPIDAVLVGAAVQRETGRAPDEVPFVGRDNEIVALLAALHHVRVGSGRLVEIVGPAGMGKTRLVEEACAQFGDVPRFSVACDVYETATPYAPFRRLLLRVLDIDPDLDPERAGDRLRALVGERCPHLLPWLPLVAAVVSATVPPTPETEALEERFRRQRLALAVTELLSACVTTSTVFVVEDVQSMDEASCDLLRAIDAALPLRPWLFVLTRRPEAGGFVATTGPHVDSLWLTPLSDEAAQALLEQLTDDAPLSPREYAAMREHGAGNPLYLLELLAARRSLGDVHALPDSLEGLLAAQIDALPTAPRRVLRAAAILGMKADRMFVDYVLEADGVQSDTETWQRLEPFLVLEPGGAFRFRHGLLREAAYETLPFRRRRQLHGRVGEALEQVHDPDSSEHLASLSFHFHNAQRYDAALRYSRLAGDRACAQFAHVEAAQFYQRAVDAAARVPSVSSAERAEIAETLGETWFHLGEFAKADAAYRLSRRYLRDDPVAQARLQLRLARVGIRAGRYPYALRNLSRGITLLSTVEAPDATAWSARLAAQYAFVRHLQGRNRETLRWAERAAAQARAVAADDALAQAYQALDLAHVALGRFDHEEYARQALAIWEARGDLHLQASVLNHLGLRAYFLGEWQEALEMYERARQAMERTGDQWNAAIAAVNIAEIFADQGRVTDAEVMSRKALRVFRASETPAFVAMANAVLGRAAARQGQFAEAYALLEAARAGYEEDGELPEVLGTEAAIAECLVLEARPDDALAKVAATIDRIPASAGVAACLPLLHRVRGYALALLGDRDGSRAAIEESLAVARRRGAQHDVALTLDAQIAIARHDTSPFDSALVVERDELFARLGIVLAPVVPFHTTRVSIPVPRRTALSRPVEPA